VIDQFEELYTLVPDNALREAFLDEMLSPLDGVADQAPNPFVFLLTLRADFMGQALTHRPFADALQAGSLMLGPMNREELQAAIEKPAEMQGAAFETGLVTRILDDVGEEPGNLPLLEFALTLLWDRLDQGWLTHGAYEENGRVDGALARYADEIFADFTDIEREQARRVFVQLVQPGQGTEDTRRVARREDFVGIDWRLVQHLADKRLIVTGVDESGSETIEVVHEALIRGWRLLRSWMSADRAFRNWQEGLRAALRSWENSSQDDGALLRGGPLAQAKEWLSDRGDEIGETEKLFIQTSTTFQMQRQQVRERRRRLILGGLTGGMVVALGLSVFAFNQRSIAEQNVVLAERSAATATFSQGQALGQAATADAERLRAESEANNRATQQVIAEEQANARATQQALAEESAQESFSRELAASAINSLDVDPERGILLALHALATAKTIEAENALHQAVQSSPLRETIYLNPRASVEYITFSPDGEKIFTSEVEGGTMWDLTSDSELFAHTTGTFDVIKRMAFSPDGALALLPVEIRIEGGGSSPFDTSLLTIVEATSGEVLNNIYVEEEKFFQEVRFSPDGNTFATVGSGRTPKIWDLAATREHGTSQVIQSFPQLEHFDVTIQFSPDGAHFVATTGDGGAMVWDVMTGEEIQYLGPDIDQITYNPNGKSLLSVSELGLIQVWDAETGERLSTTRILDLRFVKAIQFSADGARVAMGTENGSVFLLDFFKGTVQVTQTILGHTDQVGALFFTPGGNHLYSASFDGVVHVWDIGPTNRAEFGALPNSALINDLAPLKSGEILVTVGKDGFLRVWNSRTWEEVENLQLTEGTLHKMALSPDGELIATGGSEGTVTVLDTSTWQPVFTFLAHPPQSGGIYSGLMDVAFSPDGEHLATSSSSGGVSLWNSSNGDRILDLTNVGFDLAFFRDRINRVCFSPDGRYLAASVADRAILWDTATGRDLQIFSPGDWLVDTNRWYWAVEFSPDSSLLALGRSDGIYEVWELPSEAWEPGEQNTQLRYKGKSQAGFINSLQFLPSGDQIAIGGFLDTVELRDVENGDLHLNFHFPGGIYELEISADGKRLYMVGYDGSLQVTAVKIDELINLAKSRVTRSLTTEECKLYLHVDTCPALP
jgi:WD40 repeat protein